MGKEQELRILLRDKKGVLTYQELQSIGLTQYLIRKLIRNGTLERIKKGKYVHHELVEDEYFLVQQMFPSSIICLLSAAAIYNFTTHIPNRYHITVKSNFHSKSPEYPPIKFYYWRKKQYELGLKITRINGSNLRIYDKEKTVCDFLKFRKKLDINVVKEVLKTYLKDDERDLVKLKKYSKELKIESILNIYLEILL